MTDKFILDAACGYRSMWINKKHPNVVYLDRRADVGPDMVGDFRDLNHIKDGSMSLVVFDPPHDVSHYKPKETAGFHNKYSNLNPRTWKKDLKMGLAECWRVLGSGGVLIFKWNTHDAKMPKILPLLPAEPLFINKITKINARKSETIWMCFMKID